MSTTVIAVVAVAAAVVLAAVLVVLTLRRPQPSGDPFATAVDEMRTRMDELATKLSEALERAERETRHGRLLNELGSSIDLEELLDRLLDAVLQIPGFEAAMVSVDDVGDAAIELTRGMSPAESARPPTLPPAVGGAGGTLTVNYRYGPEDADRADDRIRGGVFVALVGRDAQQLGTLAAFWRRRGHEPAAEHVAAVEQLAHDSIGAIENARRYREARQLAETDALTGLFNQRFFHQTLRREVLRAQRYGRSLALIIFDLDDFKSINDRIGHLAGDDVLSQAAARLRAAIRSVDIACRIGGDEFAVILPESAIADADQLYERVQAAISATALTSGVRLRLSAGAAELHVDDTSATLFERADAALYRAKGKGKDRLELATGTDGFPRP